MRQRRARRFVPAAPGRDPGRGRPGGRGAHRADDAFVLRCKARERQRAAARKRILRPPPVARHCQRHCLFARRPQAPWPFNGQKRCRQYNAGQHKKILPLWCDRPKKRAGAHPRLLRRAGDQNGRLRQRGAVPQRRQPAKGDCGQMAGYGQRDHYFRRADTRHRRGDQARDLCHHRQAGRRGTLGPDGILGI